MIINRPFRGAVFATIGCSLILAGCEPIKKIDDAENKNLPSPVNASNDTKPPLSSTEIAKRRQQFAQMQDSLHSVAGLATSKKGPEFDYKFVMPSDDWEKTTHADGDKKASVWLFTSKKSGLKILVSCVGVKEDPVFAKSAKMVYDSSLKKHPEVTREWKVGNFTMRRSFIGFIDDRHGEATVTAFSPVCSVEFNIASESLDRDELMRFSDDAAEQFIVKNPNGGFPSK